MRGQATTAAVAEKKNIHVSGVEFGEIDPTLKMLIPHSFWKNR